MERGLTDQMTPIGFPKGRYCPDCSQESASATGKHTEMAAAFTSEWLGSERQWLKPEQVQTACVKSQLCHSQGTNTGKVQPKGTKAAPGQGLLRVKYFPKRGCGWIGWYKIFTDTMNRTISGETNSICFQHNSLGENTTNTQFRSFFSFFNPLKFYNINRKSTALNFQHPWTSHTRCRHLHFDRRTEQPSGRVSKIHKPSSLPQTSCAWANPRNPFIQTSTEAEK